MQPHDWNYIGDVSLEYGGTFVRLSDYGNDYADVVEVIDLDSATGFAGAVLVEKGTAVLPRTRKELRRVLESMGIGMLDLIQIPKERRRVELFRMVWDYGYRDHERTAAYQTDPDEPVTFDGWKAERIDVEAEGLEEFVRREWLD